jgi:hypothetical protein
VADDTLMKKLLQQYGDKDQKLRQLPIRVMSNDLDDIIQSAWCWYGGKTCGARSDGKKIVWYMDPKTRTAYEKPEETDWQTGDEKVWKDVKGNPLFKLHSVFNCVVAAEDARWGGVYKLRTTSLVTFKQLYASLTHIHQLTGGILIGMPLMLVVRPIQVAPDGKPTTVYVVHCELRGTELRQIQQQAMQQQAWMIENKQKMLTMQAQYQKMLVAPGQEGSHEAGAIAEEFQPESIEIEAAPDKFDIIDGEEPAPTDQQPEQHGFPVVPGTPITPAVQEAEESTEPIEGEEPSEPPPMPTTHDALVDTVARLCGLDMNEVGKRCKLEVPKGNWDLTKTKAGWWARFLEGEIKTLVPLKVWKKQTA